MLTTRQARKQARQQVRQQWLLRQQRDQAQLHSQIASAVQIASPDPVKDAAEELRDTTFPSGRWLPRANRYRLDTVGRFIDDCKSRCVEDHHVRRYVAASVVLHCMDGWSFLSHAVASLLAGNQPAALHLGYYAELRAAMSFLACEGIGIFDSYNVSLDQAGVCHPFTGHTHQVAWHALDAWSAVPRNTVRLLGLFRVSGVDIGQWLGAAGYAAGRLATAQLAADWLRCWGLDLKLISEDHTVRNEVSYRPQCIRSPLAATDMPGILATLVGFWAACEPSAFGQFGPLDLFLLHEGFARAYQQLPSPRMSYPSFVRQTMSQMGMAERDVLADFLCRRTVPRHPLVAQASRQGMHARTGASRPMPVIARAILMLRLASAACDDMLRAAGITKDDIEFWWSPLGAQLGLWQADQSPANITDLWADVQDTLAAIGEWLARPESATAGLHGVVQQLPSELLRLGQFQRAGLWAMGL